MTRDELAAAIKGPTEALVFDATSVPISHLPDNTRPLLAEAALLLLPEDVSIVSAACAGSQSLLLVLSSSGVVVLDVLQVTHDWADIQVRVSGTQAAELLTVMLGGIYKDNGSFKPRTLRLSGVPILGEIAAGEGASEAAIEALAHVCRAILAARERRP